jgi:integrase
VATVHCLRPGPAGPSVAEAIAGYLATLDHPETAGTRRVYASTLAALCVELGADRSLASLADAAAATQLTAWFTGRWGARAPATFNRNLDALRAALGYWHDQGWLDPGVDPSRSLRRRGRAPDRTKALSRDQIEALLTREDLGLRERTLWRLLYETAARAAEVLALDVEELDLRNRCAKVRRTGVRTGSLILAPFE